MAAREYAVVHAEERDEVRERADAKARQPTKLEITSHEEEGREGEANEEKDAVQLDMRSHTGLRGAAAVWVVAFHAILYSPLGLDFQGSAIMPLFFILSGFSLTAVYGRKRLRYEGPILPCLLHLALRTTHSEEERRRREYQQELQSGARASREAAIMDASRFYRNRVARIGPIYILANIIAAPAFYLGYGYVRPGNVGSIIVSVIITVLAPLSTLASFAVGSPLDGPAWTISTLTSFWFCFPSWLPTLQRMADHELRNSVASCFYLQLCLTIVGFPLFLVLGAGFWISFATATMNPITRFPLFLMGMMAGELCLRLERRRQQHGSITRNGSSQLAINTENDDEHEDDWAAAGDETGRIQWPFLRGCCCCCYRGNGGGWWPSCGHISPNSGRWSPSHNRRQEESYDYKMSAINPGLGDGSDDGDVASHGHSNDDGDEDDIVAEGAAALSSSTFSGASGLMPEFAQNPSLIAFELLAAFLAVSALDAALKVYFLRDPHASLLGAVWFQAIVPHAQLTVVAALAIDRGRSAASTALGTGVAQWLGRISLCLYLIHFPVIDGIKLALHGPLVWPADGVCGHDAEKGEASGAAAEECKEFETRKSQIPVWAIPLVLIVSIAMAHVLEKHFERPLRSWLRRRDDGRHQ